MTCVGGGEEKCSLDGPITYGSDARRNREAGRIMRRNVVAEKVFPRLGSSSRDKPCSGETKRQNR